MVDGPTPIGPRGKSAARKVVTALSGRLLGLQARLLAQGDRGTRGVCC